MRYDPERRAFVVDDDLLLPCKFFITESAPMPEDFCEQHHGGHKIVHEVRVVRAVFENRWALSVIWGSMTYGTNKEHPWGIDYVNHERIYPDFNDDPPLVEVGIIMPEPLVKPAETIDLPDWKGPDEFPEREIELWGEPMGWVDAAGLRWLIETVSKFDSHDWRIPSEGPCLERTEDGGYTLIVEFTDDNEKGTTDAINDDLHR